MNSANYIGGTFGFRYFCLRLPAFAYSVIVSQSKLHKCVSGFRPFKNTFPISISEYATEMGKNACVGGGRKDPFAAITRRG